MKYEPEDPTDAEEDRLKNVIHWLERRRAHVATHVLHMGKVWFNDFVETAGVRVTGSQVDLYFNREFFSKLRLVELTAVLLHESLHVVFRHQARAEKIPDHWSRRLFSYGCEAVINDTITRYFPEVELPGDPITGPGLVGCDTSGMTAEQVVALLKSCPQIDDPLFSLRCLDDHDVWDPEDSSDLEESDQVILPRWNSRSDEMVEKLMSMNRGVKLWGSESLGAARLTPRIRGRTDLKRFITEQLRPAYRYATTWSVPNRKAMAIYPDVILPSYDPEGWNVRVLMAIDSSGSVSDQFLGVARAVANQHLPGTRVRMVSFDTEVYEVEPGATTLHGGGGTDAAAVERYIHKEVKTYPDYVFIFTDGLTPEPKVLYPDRWVWLLPPHGSEYFIPKKSRIYRFDPREM